MNMTRKDLHPKVGNILSVVNRSGSQVFSILPLFFSFKYLFI